MYRKLLIVAAILAAFPVAASATTLVKSGPLFLAPPFQYHGGCWSDANTRLQLGREYLQDGFYQLWLEERAWYDGDLVSEPFLVATGVVDDAELDCGPTGEIVVHWRCGDPTCLRYRIVAEDRKSASPVRPFAPLGTGWASPRFTTWNGGYSVATLAAHEGAREDMWVQAFDDEGNALYAPTVVSTDPNRWHGRPTLAADDEGNTLVVWEEEGPSFHSVVRMIAVGASGETSGAPMDFMGDYDFPATYWTPESIVATGIGAFVHYWYSDPAGGLVAQKLRIDEIADVTTTTTSTTTTTTLEDDPTPEFGGEREWDWNETDFYWSMEPRLATDGSGGWLATWRASEPRWWFREDYSLVANSQNGGRGWSNATRLDFMPLATVSDGPGKWLAFSEDRIVYAEHWTPFLHLSRSIDGGASWSAPVPLFPLPRDAGEDCESTNAFFTARRTRTGALVAAWVRNVHCYLDVGSSTDLYEVYVARSADDGESWSAPQPVFQIQGALGYEYFDGLELENVGANDVLLLARTVFPILVRSTDDGVTWTSAGPDPEVPGWSGHSDLACDSANRCVAVFREVAGPEGNDRDGDIYATSSEDGGRTWTVPHTVNSYAFVDRADDYTPTVATDDHGLWTVAWVSHRDLNGEIGLDSDLLEASSTDAGATWSPARPINASAPSDGWLQDEEVQLAYGGGSWVALWNKRTEDWDYYNGHSQARTATAFPDCGNGNLDNLEECDDGNRTDGDGCDDNCAATGCSNGVVTEGEACDDGNGDDDDACPTTCADARCGDGFARKGFEQCDDGNLDDADSCTNACTRARCGDGIVAAGVEECDDGNTADWDACTGSCRIARCGDGIVYDDVEECDDGNSFTNDRCPANCELARCGDGYRWLGVEHCDPSEPGADGTCPDNCGVDSCGDANGDGDYTVTDSVTILSHAVGKPNDCPRSRCDLDGNFRISSRDALSSLGVSVGLAYPMNCNVGPWVTIRLQDARRVNALQFTADTSSAPISFPTHDNSVPFCEPLVPDALIAGHVDGKNLNFGMISGGGFQGPIDVARCRVEISGADIPQQIGATIQDATDAYGNELEPWPVVVLRVSGS